MKSIRKILLVPIVVIATILLAYALGVLASDRILKYRAEQKEADFEKQRAEMTQAVLAQMGTIQIGDRLEEFTLATIDGDSVVLGDLFDEQTLLVYMEPNCDACDHELANLKKALGDEDAKRRVLIISPADLDVLKEAVRGLPPSCIVLSDSDYRFGSKLQIQALPFNLVLNQSGHIQQVFCAALSPDEIQNLVM